MSSPASARSARAPERSPAASLASASVARTRGSYHSAVCRLRASASARSSTLVAAMRSPAANSAAPRNAAASTRENALPRSSASPTARRPCGEARSAVVLAVNPAHEALRHRVRPRRISNLRGLHRRTSPTSPIDPPPAGPDDPQATPQRSRCRPRYALYSSWRRHHSYGGVCGQPFGESSQSSWRPNGVRSRNVQALPSASTPRRVVK
jgi:hypothetical protein